MPTPINPFINGNLFSWASIELVANGLPIDGVKAINYSDGLEPGKVQGSGPTARGYTRGKHTADGSIEVHRDQFGDFVLSLGGPGFYERIFPMLVTYFEPELPVNLDTVVARLSKTDTSNDSGSSDATTIKLSLSIIVPVLWNGVPGVFAF